MAYDGGIGRHRATLRPRYTRLFVGVTTAVGNSVRFGSTLTGAPGQPVDTANLLTSWIDQILAPFRWQMSTNVEYAPEVERNTRGVVFRNHGPHSVDKTIGGFDKLVKAELQAVGA